MKTLLAWIVPNRCDRQLFALMILLSLAAAATMTGFDPSVEASLMNAFLAALFCFPAVIGTQSWSDIKRSIPLLMLAMLSPLLVLALGVFFAPTKNSPIYSNSIDLSLLRTTTYVIFLCSWLALLVIAIAFSKIADRWMIAGSDVKKVRVRLLMFFVGFLFLCSLAQKLAHSSMLMPYPWLQGIAGTVVGGGLLVAVTYLLSRLQRWWLRAIVSFVMLVFAALLVSGLRQTENSLPMVVRSSHSLAFGAVPVLVGAGTYFIILMLLWRPKPIDRQPGTKRVGPSLWGLTAIGVPILLLVASSLVDFGVVYNSGGTASFHLSRVLRKLKWQPGAETMYEVSDMRLAGGIGCSIVIHADFSADTPSDYFADFADVSDAIELSLDLSNLHPDIDLKPLHNKISGWVSVSESILSTQQLVDLSHNCIHFFISDCQLKESAVSTGASRTYLTPPTVAAHRMQPGSVAVLNNALQADGFNGVLHVSSCKLNDDDWQALVKLNNATNIYINACTPPSSATEAQIESTFADGTNPAISVYENDPGQIWQYISMNMHVTSVKQMPTDLETWDAFFTGHWNPVSIDFCLNQFLNQPFLGQKFRECHLVFDSENETGSIRSVLIPLIKDSTLETAGSLPELEVLSFVPRWISPFLAPQISTVHQSLNFTPLTKLKNLRELYLPSGVILDDFRFFAGLPKLKTLQFDAFHDAGIYAVPNVKAEFFPSLKRISLFSEPHPKLLLELSKLKQLEVVELLESDQLFELLEDQEKIRSLFGDNVEVRFPKTAADSNPPESFQKHLKQVRESIRQRRFPREP